MNYTSRISCDPAILTGKPTIKGTRIPIDLILKMLSAGVTYEEILDEYSDLEKKDILAAIAYARDAINEVVENRFIVVTDEHLRIR